jgi:hypothetical protein
LESRFWYKAPYVARSSSVNQGGGGIDRSTKSMISWFSGAIGVSLLENKMYIFLTTVFPSNQPKQASAHPGSYVQLKRKKF